MGELLQTHKGKSNGLCVFFAEGPVSGIEVLYLKKKKSSCACDENCGFCCHKCQSVSCFCFCEVLKRTFYMFKLICSLFVVSSGVYWGISVFLEVFRNSSESLQSFITKKPQIWISILKYRYFFFFKKLHTCCLFTTFVEM